MRNVSESDLDGDCSRDCVTVRQASIPPVCV